MQSLRFDYLNTIDPYLVVLVLRDPDSYPLPKIPCSECPVACCEGVLRGGLGLFHGGYRLLRAIPLRINTLNVTTPTSPATAA